MRSGRVCFTAWSIGMLFFLMYQQIAIFGLPTSPRLFFADCVRVAVFRPKNW